MNDFKLCLVELHYLSKEGEEKVRTFIGAVKEGTNQVVELVPRYASHYLTLSVSLSKVVIDKC